MSPCNLDLQKIIDSDLSFLFHPAKSSHILGLTDSYRSKKILLTIKYFKQKVSVFEVIKVQFFPYSVQIRENADQNKSEYGHSSRKEIFQEFLYQPSEALFI